MFFVLFYNFNQSVAESPDLKYQGIFEISGGISLPPACGTKASVTYRKLFLQEDTCRKYTNKVKKISQSAQRCLAKSIINYKLFAHPYLSVRNVTA